ncbi:MAG: hypothetical protein J6S79_08860 [Lachnospiraceae bacterium]|nr:hypothetical protein [Lachnospiraceae bacterium]
MRHLLRKLIGWMLCLAMAVGMLPGMTRGAKAAAVDSGTAGDEEGQVTLISTRAQLEALAGELDAHVILAADIDLDGSPWTPIGSSSAPFTGVLDGNGHKILNLTVDSEGDYVGLFGYIEGVKDENGNLIGGTVQNVALEGGSIKGNNYVGGVVGHNEGGIVSNCYNTGKVEGRSNVGGVVGWNSGTVSNCYNAGDVSGSGSVVYDVGGVVGWNYGTVSDCYNTGAVTGSCSVGGVVGWNERTVSNCYNTGKVKGDIDVGGVAGYNIGIVSNCYNPGVVSGGEIDVGGVAGYNIGTVSNCYNTGDVTGSGNNVGGVAGDNYQGTVSNCYNTGAVVGSNTVGGVAGDNYQGTVSNCYYNESIGQIGAVNGSDDASNKGLSTAQMTGRDALTKMVFDYGPGEESPWLIKADDEFFSYYPHLKGFNMNKSGNQLDAEDIEIKDWSSRILKDGAREISNYDELKRFAAEVNGDGNNNPNPVLCGILLNDISASASANGNPWTPIGTESQPYTGTFDGNGKKITELTIEDTSKDYVGLFGYVGSGGTVQNVALEAGSIKGNDHVGGVAGWNSGKVSNCYNTGAVRSESGDFVGGVVGRNHGTVSNCYNTGDVSGRYYVGGVAGYNYHGTVSNCYNTGAVRSESGDFVGGVAGFNYYGTVSNCYNTGDVSGRYYVGGVAGNNYSGTVSNCYYNKSICLIGAINSTDDSDHNVIGLTTPRMTGISADLSGFQEFKDANGNDVWLFKENTDGIYYYPLLACFNLDANGKRVPASDIPSDKWSNKVVFSVTLSGDSFTYNGENHMPSITEVRLNNSAQNGYKVIYLTSSDEEVDEPKDVGVYRAYVYWENGGKPGLEKSFEILPAPVTLTAESRDTDIYDGTEKTLTGFTCSVEGLTFADEVSASGKGTKAGEYDVTIGGVTPNVTKDSTGNYVVTKTINGKLTISKKTITITAKDAAKVYDGTALTEDTVSVEGLVDGDEIASVTVTGSQTMKGSSDNVPSAAKIVNVKGEDVTSSYDITYVNSSLEVTKKSLTITADSASAEYDGTALTKDSYTSSGLASGDTIKSITITGTQTEVGTTDNVPSSAKIVNAAGEDVTSCYDITYVNGTLTVTKPAAPKLADDQKPAPKKDLKEDGNEQILVLDPANLPEGYTIEYSTDGGKTWKPIPTGKESGEYTIEVFYKADENHTDFFGDTLNVIIQGVYNQTESDGDWTKGSGKTYTFRIKKAFNDEVTYDNLTGVFVDGKKAEPGKDYTPAKGSAIITFAADYLETLSVGEHKIRVTFKDGETSVPLKILAAIATPTPAVDATPVTGDAANPFLWTAMILLSMGGVVLMIEKKRRNVA